MILVFSFEEYNLFSFFWNLLHLHWDFICIGASFASFALFRSVGQNFGVRCRVILNESRSEDCFLIGLFVGLFCTELGSTQRPHCEHRYVSLYRSVIEIKSLIDHMAWRYSAKTWPQRSQCNGVKSHVIVKLEMNGIFWNSMKIVHRLNCTLYRFHCTVVILERGKKARGRSK